MEFDVAVIGLGAMGSAGAFHLARRGQRVLGIDRFSPPHDRGSSHGRSRIIREAYFEHPSYVPLVQRAYELWRELEALSGSRLLVETGGVMVGSSEGIVVPGALASARQHGLRHEAISSQELRRRFPALTADPDMVAVWEPRAGALFPEACVAAHLSAAEGHGATIRRNQPVLRWEPKGNGIELQTAGEAFRARALVVSAGSWIHELVPRELSRQFQVERQIQFWFQPKSPAVFHPERCPIYLYEYAPHHFFYGFPDFGEGVKVARHHDGEPAHPDTVRREVDDAEIGEMRALVEKFLPAANGPLQGTAVCLYTNSADEHFRIDWVMQAPPVLLASPCSGHGFKFSAAVGEVIADLITEGKSRFDLELFKLLPYCERA